MSGDRVLARVSATTAVDVRTLRVTLDGRDVGSSFVSQPDGSLLGLVTGLTAGRHTLTASARARGRSVTTSLVVVDHPGSGPVFSGPQQQPFACRTTDSGLSAATSPTCDAPTQVSFRNVATSAGPIRVRVELGVVNRAVYRFVSPAAPHDAAPDPTGPDPVWNGRLVYTFGGGCNSGYQQGAFDGPMLDPVDVAFLAAGYALATSTLNVGATNCSTVISAETAMMVKERFVDTFGPVVHTIGWGSSGGSVQQLAIADQYPGILDGVIPQQTFPEALGPVLDTVADCRLLVHLLGPDGRTAGPGGGFDIAAKTAVSGFEQYSSCRSWNTFFGSVLEPTASCNAYVPAAVIWDPVTNPDGVQCSAATQYRTQLGTDPATGFVNGVYDNVGVQYGLQALRDGRLSPDRFAALNLDIGGLDDRGQPSATRSQASPVALAAMYGDDLLTSGRQGLASTPVIDLRTDNDADPAGEIHTTTWSATLRARLAGAGDAGGLVQLVTAGPAPSTEQWLFVLTRMDRWLDAIAADSRPRSASQRIAATRPAGLVDGCFLDASATVTPAGPAGRTGTCARTFPVHANPRLAAGQPTAMTTLSCTLVPLTRGLYPGIAFSGADWTALRRAFPTGVCDYTRPGVAEDTDRRGPWIDYGSPA